MTFFEAGVTYVRDQPFKAPEINPQFMCWSVGDEPNGAGFRIAQGWGRGGSLDPWSMTAMEPRHWAWGWVPVVVDPDRV